VRACDRRRFARCRASLRHILGAILAEPAGSLRFKAAVKGKPELDPEFTRGAALESETGLRFNLSHSSHLALVAACWGRELGVDLEHVRAVSEAERIVASFFTPAEMAEFAAVAPEQKIEAFMRGWTRKEAVLKGLGVGITGLAAEYETGFGTSELSPRFTPAAPPRVAGWRIWEAAPRADFVAAVAVKEQPGAAPGERSSDGATTNASLPRSVASP
jgi:4'-phosphopantetheinyl transferase